MIKKKEIIVNINKIKEIKEKVIKKNQLTKEEYKQILNKINIIIKKIDNSLKINKINAEIKLGGSVAKETIIKNNYDCDIFIRFDKKYINENISNITQKVLSIFKNVSRVHGSRDYFNAVIDKINYEFVPVIKINSKKDALNVTDFSPLHVNWIKKKINKDKNLIKEIILTKLFAKAIKVYGAESYINGFSGHLIEILIVKYKTFENLLKESINWENNEIIDVENYNSAKNLNKSKIKSLIVIDPIDKNRNAAASLSFEKVKIFKKNAILFLNEPKISFFNKKIITIDKLKKINYSGKKIIIKITPYQNKKDITGSKIVKIYEKLANMLILNDFEIEKKNWEWDLKNDALIYVFLKKGKLEKTKIWPGPPINSKKHILLFKNKHNKTFIKNKKIYAIIKRKYQNVDMLIKDFIKQEKLINNVKNIEYVK
jgi:tRNA nucleotidyltransferase (CCA-adding enzyme)